jgi:hypothetical protein
MGLSMSLRGRVALFRTSVISGTVALSDLLIFTNAEVMLKMSLDMVEVSCTLQVMENCIVYIFSTTNKY